MLMVQKVVQNSGDDAWALGCKEVSGFREGNVFRRRQEE